MIEDPVFYAAVVPAVILLGLSKGGFTGISMLAMPLMALVISPIQGAAIILPILIVQDVVGVWAYRRNWDRRNMAILLPGACCGVALAYIFAAQVSDAGITFILGLISLLFALRRLLLGRAGDSAAPRPAPIPAGLFWGAFSGFTSMIANAGAPPFQIYVIPQRLPKDVFIGTGIIFFAALNWIKLPFFIALGQLTRGSVMTSLVLFPLAIVATWTGVLLVRRIPAERFLTIIYLLMIGVGSRLLWTSTKALF